MTDAQQLFLKDGTATKNWFCNKCKVICYGEQVANDCCAPRLCACGKEVKGSWSHCDECREKVEREHEKRIMELAELIPYSGQPFFNPEDDKFYNDTDQYEEHCADNEITKDKIPVYVYGVKTFDEHLDLGTILDSALDEVPEEVWDGCNYSELENYKELEAAVDAFNKANKKSLTYYEPDYRVKYALKEWYNK